MSCWLRLVLCVLGLGLLGVSGAADSTSARKLTADGTWVPFAIETPGAKVTFGFDQRSGCRYRMTVEPQGLPRPVVDLAFGEMPPQRFGAPERGQPAVHEWEAEGSRRVWAEVSGFSALTGTARIKVEGVGPDGAPQRKPEPWLGVTAGNARVGDLLLGEPERWPLVVEAGRAYEIEPTRGQAHGVLLRVVGADGQELATSLRPWIPFDPLRVRFPSAPTPAPAPAAPTPGAPAPVPALARPMLEVRGLGGSGGTYGLRLTLLPDGEPLAAPPSQPPAPMALAPLPGESLGFTLNPGDVALLFGPRGPGGMTSARVEQRLGEAWQDVGVDAPVGTLRSQEGDHMTCFRAEASGTYRFVPFPPDGAPSARPQLFSGAKLGGAPLLLGLATDPLVRVKVGSAWRCVGVAVAVPGFDYLYVAEGAPEAGVAMRVRAPDDKLVAARPTSGDALTFAAGLGPSLRFRAPGVTLLRLEAKGGGQVLRALLRRASN